MTKSPSINKDRVLAWSIYCDGNKLDDSYELIFASVYLELSRIGKATLKFNAGDMEKQTFWETDSDGFKPGSSIRLDMGEENHQDTLFEGMITEVGIHISEGNRSQMVLECRDFAYPATQVRKNRIFEQKKDSEMIKEVLSAYGSVEVDSTAYQHQEMVQYYCSDWDFALSRADACGLFLLVRGRDIAVIKPKVTASPVLTVTCGVDLIAFEGGLSCREQFSRYEGVSWDPSQQKPLKVTSALPILNNPEDLQASEISSADSLLLQTDAPEESRVQQEWGNSMALRGGRSCYQGCFSFYGAAEAIPGCLIELKGLGKRFNGDVFVGSVRHTIENNEWVTEAGIGISPSMITEAPEVATPPVSGFLPGLEGLHAGIVKQVHGDPAKEYRIRVELPWMDGTKKALWARFSTLCTTGSSGSLFLPEKGDEVLVGFINHDPCHPVVLGGLYGKKHQPPFAFGEKNDKKNLVTREKLALEFDEEKKVITLRTPGNNTLEISDEGKFIKLSDQNKNEIVMDGSGISFSSAKDITLKAKGNISMTSTAKTEISANSDLLINGANVKASARIGFSAKGDTSAELSASGQTIVKGGMVMIN